MNTKTVSIDQVRATQAKFMTQVYSWMSFGLLLTGLVAFGTVSRPSMIEAIVTNRILFFGLIIAELLCVGYLVSAINKISSMTATLIFIGYALLNGLTLSVIFLAYTASSIASTFFVTAGTFAVMSVYGYFTKKDLTSIGNLAFMVLIGIIIASLVNMFLESSTLYWIITYLGIIVFVGLIAYDTQKIKRMIVVGEEQSEQQKKAAVLGALSLYLDFINLFILLLRVLGRRE